MKLRQNKKRLPKPKAFKFKVFKREFRTRNNKWGGMLLTPYAALQHMLQVQNGEVFVNPENFPLDRNSILNTFKKLPTKVVIPN